MSSAHNTNGLTGSALHVRHSRTTTGQKKNLARLAPHWVLPQPPVDLRQAFANDAPVILEIGAGTGDVVAQLAQRHLEHNYLVAEVYPGGVAQLLRHCEQQQLQNIRVVMHDAVHVLQQCPDSSLRQIMVFFPDPWSKKRHHKRRLLQAKILDLMASKLVPWGRIHISTDDAGYAEHIAEALTQQSSLLNLNASNNMPRPNWRKISRYEQKAIMKNSKIHEWLLARNNKAAKPS